MSARFVVTELTGWRISGSRVAGHSQRPATDFYVQDRLYLYAVVHALPATSARGRGVETRRQEADRERDRLNAWWQAELAVG